MIGTSDILTRHLRGVWFDRDGPPLQWPAALQSKPLWLEPWTLVAQRRSGSPWCRCCHHARLGPAIRFRMIRSGWLLEISSRSLLATIENNQIEAHNEPSRSVYHQAIRRPGKLAEILKPGVILCRSQQVGNLQRCKPHQPGAQRAPTSRALPLLHLCTSRKLRLLRKIRKSLRGRKSARSAVG